MKKIIVAAAMVLLVRGISAQSDYEKRAAEVKEEIWGAKDPDFDGNNVPEQYKNESAVILAKKMNISAQTKSHFKVGLLSFAANKEIIFQNLLHEKVVLQDKAALEDFSEISYQKVSKKSYGSVFIRFKDKLNTFIGARVYKKDGSMKEVMMSEAVITKDSKNEKEEKLAISDLQVGDILDFYILSEENRELSGLDPMTFLFTSEYPIVKFSLSGKISNKYGVEYKCLNGAPDLKINKDADDNMNFDIKVFNVKKYTADKWISPVRQVPIVRLNIFLSNSKFKAGQISKGMAENEIYEDEKIQLQRASQTYRVAKAYSAAFYIPDRIGQVKMRLGKDIPVDSTIVAIYNALRSYIYFRIDGKSKIQADKSVNESGISNKIFCQYLSYCLADYEIENEVIFYPTRYMTRLSDMLTTDDLTYMVKAKGSKNYYMFDDGMFTSFNTIPYYAEGEKAITLSYGKLKDIMRGKESNILQSSMTIPISTADKNKRIENFSISLNLAGTPFVTVKRETIATGHERQDDQKSLLLFEDYYPEFKKDLGIKLDFLAQLEESKKTKTLSEEWRSAFAKARETYKDGFINDLKGNYETEPKELISYKIDKMGILKAEPEFKYTTEYVYNDWLKRAGNNFLFEAGKLIGGQLKVKEEQRTRTVDIYQPYARSYEYNLNIVIPAGYSVEGIEAFNKKVENETGKFVSTAAIDGDKITIKTYKEYSHNYEPAENWNKILSFVDAANDFTNQKLLLKKM